MAKTKLTGTFEEVLSDLGTITEDAVRDMLVQSIEFLVLESPVDTGAYIESHTLSNTAGAPRSRSARGRKRKSGKPSVAREQLMSDLGKLDLTKDVFNIRNNSPHASIVENNPRGNISKSHVYTRLANILGGATVDTGAE